MGESPPGPPLPVVGGHHIIAGMTDMDDDHPDATPERDGDSFAGQLLVAMPGMGDSRFAGSVVYLCAHSGEGALGLIVNKPAPEIRFRDLLQQLEIEVEDTVPDIRVHFGGPVETARGFVLHSTDYSAS